jgi:hypothetical protein
MVVNFRMVVQYTETFTPSFLQNIYFWLLLHVSATEYGHLQGPANFTELYSVHCK